MAHPNIHVTFTGVLDAPRGTLGLPALDYAKATQYLTPAQQQALNALLRTFVEHPRYATPERYLQATAEVLQRPVLPVHAEILGEADDEDNFTPVPQVDDHYDECPGDECRRYACPPDPWEQALQDPTRELPYASNYNDDLPQVDIDGEEV